MSGDKIEVLEKKYQGIRNENFFSKSPFSLVRPRNPGFEGVVISFDIQIMIRPSDDASDPGYITIRGVSLREGRNGRFISLPGKRTGSGNWFSFVELHSSLEDAILKEAEKLASS